MDIRCITRQDLANCADAFMKAYNQLPWNYQWKTGDAVKYLTEYMDGPHFKGLAIYEDGKVLGALFGHTKTWWTNNQFIIDELFVAADSQGRGIGKILLQQAEMYAQENSIKLITLMTNKLMPAINFYDKNDFCKVDQYVFMFKNI